jgi:hypothetical protein
MIDLDCMIDGDCMIAGKVRHGAAVHFLGPQ